MFKLPGNPLSRFSLLFVSLSLAACGGGGSGGSSDGGSDPDPVATTANPGFFMTEITYASGEVARASTLLSSTGKYATVINDADGTFGTLTFAGDNTFSGTGTNVFFDQTWQSVDGSLEGNVISSEALAGTYTAPDVDSDIKLRRANEISDLGVTLQGLNGSYVMSPKPENPGGVKTTVNIASDGTVDGQDTTNCNFEGTISIPDTAYNIFEGNLSLSLCGDIEGGATGAQRNGDYQVLGSYDPEINQLLFTGTNGTVVALFISDGNR